MRVEKNYVGFTNDIYIGKFSLFITLGNSGVELSVNDMVNRAQHFNYVVLNGDEPLKQKHEIAEFLKKLRKKNKNCIIQINTHGTIKPIGINNISNLLFVVQPLLKNSGVTTERIKYDILNWFGELKSNFKFLIECDDDIDEAVTIINTVELSKSQVYFLSNSNDTEVLKYIMKMAKLRGYNFTPMLNVLLEDKNE